MRSFSMNGYLWHIRFVDPYDSRLVDRTNKRTVATTDPSILEVCLSSELSGDFLITVMLHELAHCAIFSYGLLDDIHRMVEPYYWIEAEEWICNFMANYGYEIFSLAYKAVGIKALDYIPLEFDRRLAS